MVDKKEFLERVLHDDLLRPDESEPQKSLNDFFDGCAIEDVPDDYDMGEDYGLCTGDSENARNHLLKILKVAYQEMEAMKYYATVQKDLENWLSCIDIFEYDKELQEVFYIMVCLGYGKCVYAQIEHEYNSFNNNRKDYIENDIWTPTYTKTYMRCGDYCLFVEGNVFMAMKFYRLAICDWHGLLTGVRLAQGVTARAKHACNRDSRQVEELQRYYDLLPAEKQGILCKSKTIAEIYNKYIWCRGRRCTCSNEKLELILEFAKLREKTWNSSDIKKKRLLMVISHRLCADSVADIIATIYDENIDKIAEKQMLTYLCRAEEQKYAPVQHLFQQYRYNPDIMKLIHSLMRASVCADKILRNLRVTEFDIISKTLAYYTSLETLCYMLPKWNDSNIEAIGRLSVMNIAYMNDPNEGKFLNRVFQKTDRSGRWKQFMALIEGNRKSVEYPYVFMKCFTTLVDDLPMWEMYGSKAQGCCIVFDNKTFLERENENINQLYQVCYLNINEDRINIDQVNNAGIRDTGTIEDALEEIRNIGINLFSQEGKGEVYRQACLEFMVLLNQICYLFKSDDYKHEQEVRLLYSYSQISDDFLHTNKTDEKWAKLFIQPKFPVRIKEIVIGPKCSEIYNFMPYLQEQIALMCQHNGTDVPRITRSSIQYQ